MKKPAQVAIPILAIAVLVAAALWQRWYSGRVVAEAHFTSGDIMPGSDLTCIVREYPQSVIPFSSDGYFYGCEVRWRQVLLSSIAYSWDSFTADHCSVTINSPHDAVFSIGDRRIHCSHIGWGGATWETPR